MSHPLRKFLLSVATLTPLLFFVYTTFLAPHPYTTMATGNVQNVYYSARLVYFGQPLWDLHAPGVPAFYLASLPLFFLGPHFDTVQIYYDVMNFTISLMTTASLFAFAYTLLRDIPIGVAILSMSSLLAGPSFLGYLEYYGFDSFSLALGLPTVSIFWLSLKNGKELDKRKIFLCGMGLGACLAIKMTFFPLGVALLIGWSIHIVLSARNYFVRSLKTLLLFPLGAAAAYLALTFPVFSRLPAVWVSTLFFSSETHPQGLRILKPFLHDFSVLLKINPPFALLLIVATVVFLYLLATYTRHYLMKGAKLNNKAEGEEDRNWIISGGAFLLLMILACVYTLACYGRLVINVYPALTEFGFRNAAPTFLFLPFLFLYSYRLSCIQSTSARVKGSGLQLLLVMAGLVLATFTITNYLHSRHGFISEQRKARVKLEEALEKFKAFSEPNSRIAFYDIGLTEVSNHFYGNAWYANGYFDQTLLEKYPPYTFFRLQHITGIIKKERSGLRTEPIGTKEDGQRCHVLADKPLLCSIWRFWKRFFPVPDTVYVNDEIVSGERFGVKVSLIALRRKDLIKEMRRSKPQLENSWRMDELLSLIQSRFGKPEVEEQNIGGIDWILVSLPGQVRQI